MNRYEKINAIEKIRGYYIPRPGERPEAAFERARAETILHMQRAMDNLKEITLRDFFPNMPTPDTDEEERIEAMAIEHLEAENVYNGRCGWD